jgi:hypothetical protein
VTLVMATHDINVVPAMADFVYVLIGGGEIVMRGTPAEIFADPERLRRSNVEVPVLSELFQRLEQEGMVLGRPLTVEDAVRALRGWSATAPVGRPGTGDAAWPRRAGDGAPAGARGDPDRGEPGGLP